MGRTLGFEVLEVIRIEGEIVGLVVLEVVEQDGEIDGLIVEIDGITEGKFPFFDGLKVDGRGVGWKLVGLVQL